jgi:hypothetical protein
LHKNHVFGLNGTFPATLIFSQKKRFRKLEFRFRKLEFLSNWFTSTMSKNGFVGLKMGGGLVVEEVVPVPVAAFKTVSLMV